MRYRLIAWVLMFLKYLSRTFWRVETHWVGEVPSELWRPYRVVAILNHTSLYEWLFAGVVPNRFLRHMARHGVVPIADKTLKRPLAGRFWRLIAGNVVSITRERDHTWRQVIEAVDEDAMVIILPEGRMKREGGLDKNGRAMTVRSGIGDLLLGIEEGRLLVAYSQGLHNIQVPEGSFFPKLGQPVRMRLEEIDIASYRAKLGADEVARGEREEASFKRRLVRDLTARRDRYCTSDLGGTDEPEAWAWVRGRDAVKPEGSAGPS